MMWRRRASVRLGTEQDLAGAGHALHCASPLAADQRCVTGLLDGPFRFVLFASFVQGFIPVSGWPLRRARPIHRYSPVLTR